MSWHEPDSELSRVNRYAVASVQPLHPHTRTVLEAALQIARLSAGAFDPCVAVSLTRWGLLPRPSDSALPAHPASWRDIELSPTGVRFHRPLWMDLGGIAKGFAVDLAVHCLLRAGIEDIVVNAGGDLRVNGGRHHDVAIRHPHHAHAMAHQLRLQDEALATSSAFESRRAASTVSVCALVDPLTDKAYPGSDSISVRAPSCMTADALTKVALFAPAPVAAGVLQTFKASCLRLLPSP